MFVECVFVVCVFVFVFVFVVVCVFVFVVVCVFVLVVEFGGGLGGDMGTRQRAEGGGLASKRTRRGHEGVVCGEFIGPAIRDLIPAPGRASFAGA